MSEFRSFPTIAINRVAFLITVVTWSFQVRLADSINPRYFREMAVLTVMSQMQRVICGSGYGNVCLEISTMCAFAMFTNRLHSFSHREVLSTLSCRLRSAVARWS